MPPSTHAPAIMPGHDAVACPATAAARGGVTDAIVRRKPGQRQFQHQLDTSIYAATGAVLMIGARFSAPARGSFLG